MWNTFSVLVVAIQEKADHLHVNDFQSNGTFVLSCIGTTTKTSCWALSLSGGAGVMGDIPAVVDGKVPPHCPHFG